MLSHCHSVAENPIPLVVYITDQTGHACAEADGIMLYSQLFLTLYIQHCYYMTSSCNMVYNSAIYYWCHLAGYMTLYAISLFM